VGRESLSSLTSGNSNVAIGKLALFTTNGSSNVAIGQEAARLNSNGSNNVVIGFEAHYTSTGAASNVAIGYQSAYHNTSGSALTCVGLDSGKHNTTGGTNTFIGSSAGKGITSAKLTGSNNTTVGSGAGLLLQGAGNANTFLGSDAGDSVTTGVQNICIGVNANPNSATDNNAIVTGHDITGAPNDFTFGKASNVVFNDFDTDAAWTRSSDERLKKNITDQTLGLDFINDLRTVKYKWKANGELDASDSQLAHLREEDDDGNIINYMNTSATMYNFIAQEVKVALDTAGVSEFGGWKEDHHGVQQVSREMFVIPLVKAVQELSTALDAALARIAVLEG